jgi:predicted peptidase
MQNRTLFLATLFSLLSLLAMAQKQPPPFKKFAHTTKTDTLPYGLLSPLKITPGEKYPLVIFLHGAGERGNDNDKHIKHIQILFNRNVLDKYPSFVLAPQCPEKQVWSEMMWGKSFGETPTKPMQMVIELIDKIILEYPVDASRIYVTGVSMGGFGTWDLIMRFPYRFAAAVPICGGGDEKAVEKIKHIPLWVFHGTEDDVVSPTLSRKMVNALQKAGVSPGYTEFPGVKHSSWNQAYREPHLMPWLFRQTLVQKAK